MVVIIYLIYVIWRKKKIFLPGLKPAYGNQFHSFVFLCVTLVSFDPCNQLVRIFFPIS